MHATIIHHSGFSHTKILDLKPAFAFGKRIGELTR